jgi:RND family efflux transporter MFP subunit
VLLSAGVAGAAEELPTLDCVITPYKVVDVASPVPGVLGAVHAERSDLIEQGQVLAELASEVERASVALAKARSVMEHDIELGEINLAFEQRKQKRVGSLYQKKAVSFHDIDKAETDAALSGWKLRQARDVFQLRQLELRKARAVLRQKTVRSPIQGVVVQRFKSEGEYVEDQPILRIAQLDPLSVEAIVPMELFGQVRRGMRAVVVPETVASTPVQASVKLVDRMGDAASGTFGVRLEIPNQDHGLPAGLKCTVRFLPDTQLSDTVADAPSPRPVAPRPGNDYTSAPGKTAQVAANPVSPALSGERPRASAEPVDSPLLPLLPTCRAVGPLQSPAQAEQLALQLRQQGVRVRHREESAFVSEGYIVLTPRQDTRKAARALEARLRQSGVQDILRMGSGRYAGYLALGVYDRRPMAERRRNELTARGFETQVHDLIKRRTQAWLNLEFPAGDRDEPALRETLDRVALGLQVKPVACPAVLTAER